MKDKLKKYKVSSGLKKMKYDARVNDTIYYEKLKAFCEGLEMESIDHLLTKSPAFFRNLGRDIVRI